MRAIPSSHHLFLSLLQSNKAKPESPTTIYTSPKPPSPLKFPYTKNTTHTMPNPRILLLGGHGKVSLLLTPKLVQRSWDVISVIRNPSQKAAILEAGKNGPGKIEVLVESLEDVKSEGDATKVLEKARPDWVVWSAGLSPLPSLLRILALSVWFGEKEG